MPFSGDIVSGVIEARLARTRLAEGDWVMEEHVTGRSSGDPACGPGRAGGTGQASIWYLLAEPEVRQLTKIIGVRAARLNPHTDLENVPRNRLAPGCLLVDLNEFDSQMVERVVRRAHQVVVPTLGVGRRPDARLVANLFKLGMLDWVEKPLNPEALLPAISSAVARARETQDLHLRRHRAVKHFESLTPREAEIFWLICHGLSNRQISEKLSISEKTVEVHRCRIMQKMTVTSLAQLVREAVLLEGAMVMTDAKGQRCHTGQQ